MTNHADIEVLCNNITLLRKLNRMTQKQMAELMDVSVYCVRKVEHGELPPMFGIQQIFHLSQHFGLHPSAFFSPITKLSMLIKKEAP